MSERKRGGERHMVGWREKRSERMRGGEREGESMSMCTCVGGRGRENRMFV